MAYFLKYKLEYTSHGKYDTKIEILKKDYEGVAISLVGSATPFQLAYESSDNTQFPTFKNSYCTLEVKLTDEIKSDFIEIEDEDDFILRYYRNNNLTWSGYILQEQYQEGDDNNQPFVSLKFYDAISRLRVFTVEDTNLAVNNYSFSLASIFQSVNELLYSEIGSNGFLGNNFLHIIPSTINEPCYAVNVINNSLGFIYFTYRHCITGCESTIFLNVSEQVTVNCANAKSFKLNNISIGNLLTNTSITKNQVVFSRLAEQTTCEIGQTNSNMYDFLHIKKKSLYNKDNIPKNLYTILLDIASSFNFSYLLYKNSFCVHNFEFSKNPKFIDFGNSNVVVSFNQHTDINSNQFWINKSKNIEFYDSLKKIEVYHEFDNDPNFIEINDITDVVKLREYISSPNPITTENSITFNTYADVKIERGATSPTKHYKDVSVMNVLPYIINNATDEKFRFSFNVKLEFDYGIDDEEFNLMDESERIALENSIKDIEEHTEVRIYFQVQSVNEGTTRYYNGFKTGISAYDVNDWTIEVNKGLVQIGKRGTASISIDELIDGFDYTVDIPTREGLNDLYIKFFQPYVYCEVADLDSGNNLRIEGVRMILTNISLVSIDSIDLEEVRYVGTTDRNVFNYNLNRDKNFQYVNIEESGYQYNIINPNGKVFDSKPFKRRTRDYQNNKNEELNIQDFLITQSLEQFAYQQQYISGDLIIRGDVNFNIFSTIDIDNKTFPVLKFNYNDKSGIYQIDLIELK